MGMGDLAASDEYDPFAAEKFVNPAVGPMIGSVLAPRPRDENSPVEYTTASPLVNITTQDIADATDKALAFSGGGLGIKAYHSSPHDFDAFDLSKIGTGEGAQVYGHGLYFAENPQVSGQGGQYWNQFLNKFEGPEQQAAKALKETKFDREAVIADNAWEIKKLEDHLKYGRFSDPLQGEADRAYSMKLLAQRQAQHDLLTSGQPIGPRTYEVDINASPEHFLDWDKTVPAEMQTKMQGVAQAISPSLYERIFGTGRDINKYGLTERVDQMTGQSALGQLKRGLGSDAAASAALREAGIPGIKYLDEGSRGIQRPTVAQTNTAFGGVPMLETIPSPKQTHNYVVFDPALIKIMKKYGIAGAAPVGMGALAAQDQYQQE
jgi:hypothetical protein